MSAFQELDRNLKIDCSEHIWTEYWLSESIPLMREFGQADWQELRDCWKSRAYRWQSRCAVVIQFGELDFGNALLAEMLLAPCRDVAIRASESLRSLGSFAIPNKSEVVARFTTMLNEPTSNLDQIANSEFLRVIEP